jgi:Rifampin ADP-ribosyl transferase
MTSTMDAAIWGAELAAGEGPAGSTSSSRPARSRTTPNLTDKKFPGNPTQSCRSREPLRIVGEVTEWQGHPQERLKEMKDSLARMEAEGGAEIID